MKQVVITVDEETGEIMLEVPSQNVKCKLTKAEVWDLMNFAEGATELIEKFESGIPFNRKTQPHKKS